MSTLTNKKNRFNNNIISLAKGEYIMEITKKHLWKLFVICVFIGMIAVAGVIQAAEYDVVILNG